MAKKKNTESATRTPAPINKKGTNNKISAKRQSLSAKKKSSSKKTATVKKVTAPIREATPKKAIGEKKAKAPKSEVFARNIKVQPKALAVKKAKVLKKDAAPKKVVSEKKTKAPKKAATAKHISKPKIAVARKKNDKGKNIAEKKNVTKLKTESKKKAITREKATPRKKVEPPAESSAKKKIVAKPVAKKSKKEKAIATKVSEQFDKVDANSTGQIETAQTNLTVKRGRKTTAVEVIETAGETTPKKNNKSKSAPKGEKKRKYIRRSQRPVEPVMLPKYQGKHGIPSVPKSESVRPRNAVPIGSITYPEKDLEFFREVIIEKIHDANEELHSIEGRLMDAATGDFHDEDATYSLHMAEQGTDAMEREKAFLFAARERKFISHLYDALQRIKSGIYGICITCGNLIEKGRLEAVPHARMCVSCKNRTKNN